MLAVSRRWPDYVPSGGEESIFEATFSRYGHSSLTSGGMLPGLSLREQLGIPSPKTLAAGPRGRDFPIKDEDGDDEDIGDIYDPSHDLSQLLADDDCSELADSISSMSMTEIADTNQWQDAETIAAALQTLDYVSRRRQDTKPDIENPKETRTLSFAQAREELGRPQNRSWQPFSGPKEHSTTYYPSKPESPLESVAPRKSKPSESPGSKLTFKSFYREFWTIARTDPQGAFRFAITKLDSLPEKLHWRVCMEIADLAKRQNRINKARKWYKMANKLEPFAAQTWLEHAKMEEECGELIRCQKIVRLGLLFCEYNESLLIKAIKHQERIGNINAARAVLARLKNVSVEKVWRTILEGALLEARAGNNDIARRIFKYLMKYVPWYGPVFFEACRFEERQEEYARAVAVAERGLTAVPKYGPLWFIAFRLYQKLHPDDPSHARQIIRRAMDSISHDVVWKLYFEAAQMEENISRFEESRRAYAESVKHCPKNLCWKAWLSGSRMELRTNRIDVARLLINRSLNGVPKKMRSVVLIECARLEEYAGNTAKARAILRKAQEETNEWKVYLESVLLEARANDMEAAIKEAENALKGHAGTGRLWAVLIQLKQIHGQAEQMRIFRKAIKEVPKSGEVWCEGARMRLDPTGAYFNLKAAHRFLNFAIEFTPQYGDSFIEYLRLKILLQGEAAEDAIERVKQLCINADPNYGSLWFYCKRHPLDTASEVMARAIRLISKDLMEHRSLYQQAILNNWYRIHSSPSKTKIPSLLQKSDPRVVPLTKISEDIVKETPVSHPVTKEKPSKGKSVEPRTWAAIACKGGKPKLEKKGTTAPPKKSTKTVTPTLPVTTSTAIPPSASTSKKTLFDRPTTSELEVPIQIQGKGVKQVKNYKVRSINSLFRLYPRIDRLTPEERHMVLFGADPITA